jgi:hypothetical protein
MNPNLTFAAFICFSFYGLPLIQGIHLCHAVPGQQKPHNWWFLPPSRFNGSTIYGTKPFSV